jgi:hypothetical protein
MVPPPKTPSNWKIKALKHPPKTLCARAFKTAGDLREIASGKLLPVSNADQAGPTRPAYLIIGRIGGIGNPQ